MNALMEQPTIIAAEDRKVAETFFRVELKGNDSRLMKHVREADALRGIEGLNRTLYVMQATFRNRAAMYGIIHRARLQRFTVRFV